MKLGVGVALVVGVASAFAACSKSDDGGPPAMHEQGGEPAVAGGGGSAPLASGGIGGEMPPAPAAGAGGEPSAGGVPASSGAGAEPNVPAMGGAGGASGESGAGGSAGDAGGEPGYVPITCGVGSASVAAGLLNGKAFSSPMKLAGAGAINLFNDHYWHIAGTLGDTGFARAWGTTTYYDSSVKMPSDGQGDLRMPSSGPLAGEHLCSAKSDAMEGVYNAPHSVHFRDLSTLGKCPATPGSGSLAGCFEQTTARASVACKADEMHIKGMVGTTQVDERWFINFGAPQYSNTRAAMTFGHGGLLDVDLGDGGTGELIFPSDSAVLPGVVVCVGVSKVTPDNLGSSYVFTLDALGSLGACPGTPVTGFVDACF
ncbi:MAG TPA: hypothetical protein VNG33_01840 [Polyangiaceae bacterium]|nr:hypothetical protein [Polyangiaceae bacterium]